MAEPIPDQRLGGKLAERHRMPVCQRGLRRNLQDEWFLEVYDPFEPTEVEAIEQGQERNVEVSTPQHVEHAQPMTTHATPPRALDAEGKLGLTLRVNGRDHAVRARPWHTLLDVLRNEVGLTGPREGCGVGMCGACTVLVDGRPVSACLMLAPMAEGHDLVTIEGLQGPNGELYEIQQAYVDHTAFQCSYCTPGFVLTTKALLEESPDPSLDDAKHYLAGNLCRCGSYVKILDAVMDAKERVRAG